MRFLLAVSAILATGLLSGPVLAHPGWCEDCGTRDRPDVKRQVMERFSSAAPREQLPDRRAGREKPDIITNKGDPRDVAKQFDPQRAGRPLVKTGPSDKPLPTTPIAQKPGGLARDMINGHLAKKGRHVGGKADVDQTAGSLPVAKSTGIKLKILQIQKPVNARLQISSKLPCSQSGECINGETNDPTPKTEIKNATPSPNFVEKVTDFKAETNKRQLSQSQVKAPMAATKKVEVRRYSFDNSSSSKAPETTVQPTSKSRPDDR